MMRPTGQSLNKFLYKAKLVCSFGQNSYTKSFSNGFEINDDYDFCYRSFFKLQVMVLKNPNCGSKFKAVFKNLDAN